MDEQDASAYLSGLRDALRSYGFDWVVEEVDEPREGSPKEAGGDVADASAAPIAQLRELVDATIVAVEGRRDFEAAVLKGFDCQSVILAPDRAVSGDLGEDTSVKIDAARANDGEIEELLLSLRRLRNMLDGS